MRKATPIQIEPISVTVVMTSEIIDEVWHNLIFFTKDYQEFSMLVYGEYSHHLSSIAAYSSPITDNDVKMFIKAYKEYFGTINSIWYYKINKNIKDNSKNNTNKQVTLTESAMVSVATLMTLAIIWQMEIHFLLHMEHPKKAIPTRNRRTCSQELIPIPFCII